MKKMTMLAVLMGVILVAGTVNAGFVVYKTSATVQIYNPLTGASLGKNAKVETYTIINTAAVEDNAYSIWFGKLNKVKTYAGTIYANDPAFGNFNDMFRGYETLRVSTPVPGATQLISSFEEEWGQSVGTTPFIQRFGMGQMYSGKVAKNGILATSLKGSYTFWAHGGTWIVNHPLWEVANSPFDQVGAGLSVNRSFKYDKKMTSAAAAATSMNAAASAVATILYKDGKGYASQGGNP